MRAVNRDYKRLNVERDKARHYGVEPELVRNLLAVPCCQSCGKPFQSFGHERLDHCHEAGHVRGVLCNACNISIQGNATEALIRLRRCIQYLERDAEWQSLEVSCPG